MATLSRTLTMAALACFGFPGCGKLVGLNTPVTPLAQVQVQVAGDIASVPGADAGEQAPQLRVALVWGTQWLPEPFCVVPPTSVDAVRVESDWKPPSADAVVAAGCPDSFRFVPDRAGADIAVQPGVQTITLINLPAADVMVGDVTARVAYASLIVYDDRNGNGTLDFHHPPLHRRHSQPDVVEDAGPPATRDIVYGASFISMTLPDQRVAYLEGTFDKTAAFYPRFGCDSYPPLPGFSILSAGGYLQPGYAQSDLVAAVLQRQLTETSCGVATLDEVVTIPLQPTLQPPASLAELACTVNDTGGTTFYREPPANAPDLSTLDWACVGFPHLPGDNAGAALGNQLVVASASTDACQSVNHYTLRGCDNDPSCSAPSWDVTATPPDWWPCPTTP